MAIASIYAQLGAGVPTKTQTDGAHRISPYVKQLDSQGQVTWTDTASGGRTATIPFELISEARNEPSQPGKGTLRIRKGPEADVGGFTNLGRIANIAASYACIDSGEYALSDSVASLATEACTQLLEQVPGAPVAEKAWNIYQGAPQPGTDGSNVNTIFRFFYNTASAPKLTESICKKSMEVLTSTACQGKGDKGGSTRGGEIKVGTGDDYTMIGFDPNEV